jgi:hypothetical protein
VRTSPSQAGLLRGRSTALPTDGDNGLERFGLAASSDERTARGFRAPRDLAERTRHADDAFYVVRLSKHERELLRPGYSGVSGRFCLLPVLPGDNTYELVRYADAE